MLNANIQHRITLKGGESSFWCNGKYLPKQVTKWKLHILLSLSWVTLWSGIIAGHELAVKCIFNENEHLLLRQWFDHLEVILEKGKQRSWKYNLPIFESFNH